ncbi:MAG: EamA family transporter [Atopobiaceae bacterium]|nr:EamA family transporter [Atopobiaceae bacterium]
MVSVGLSVWCYVSAQRYLGVARTSALYASAPYIGALIGLVLFKDPVQPLFWFAFALMVAGTILSILDSQHV